MFDNIEEVKQRLEQMKSHFRSGFSSIEQDDLEVLYLRIFSKPLQRRKGCQDCYRDAFMIISNKLKSMTEMPKQSLYKLKAGVVASSFGSSEFYVLDMPEEAAEKWLHEFPDRINLFQAFPEDWEDRVKSRFDEDPKFVPEATIYNEDSGEFGKVEKVSKRGRKKAIPVTE